MELNEKDLNEVSGGKILETKDGKWIAVPDNILMFDTEAEAKASEQTAKHMFGHFARKKHSMGGHRLSGPAEMPSPHPDNAEKQ